MALSLILAFSLPAYAQKAKPAPMAMEDMDKMMEECMQMMGTSMEKMKEMHEKMHKGEMKMDPAMMKKMKKDVKAVYDTVDKVKNIMP